jgi:hypothetical protein
MKDVERRTKRGRGFVPGSGGGFVRPTDINEITRFTFTLSLSFSLYLTTSFETFLPDFSVLHLKGKKKSNEKASFFCYYCFVNIATKQ